MVPMLGKKLNQFFVQADETISPLELSKVKPKEHHLLFQYCLLIDEITENLLLSANMSAFRSRWVLGMSAGGLNGFGREHMDTLLIDFTCSIVTSGI